MSKTETNVIAPKKNDTNAATNSWSSMVAPYRKYEIPSSIPCTTTVRGSIAVNNIEVVRSLCIEVEIGKRLVLMLPE